MSKPPTILIVPGAWIFPEAYTDVLSRFHDIPNELISLPCLGMSPPSKDISENIKAIQEILAREIDENGNEVILILHSIGGLLGTEAAKGFSKPERLDSQGGIIGVIYVAAAQPPMGMTQMEYVMGFAKRSEECQKCVEDMQIGSQIEEDGSITKTDPSTLYNDLESEQQKYWASKQRSESTAVFALRTTSDSLYRNVPSFYLFMTRDRAVPPLIQHDIASFLATSKNHIIPMESDHVPFLSHPKELEDVIRQVIKRIQE